MPCQWLRYHCRAVVARLHSGFGLVGSPGAENIHLTKYLAAMARGPMGAPGAGCTCNEVSRILRTRCRFSCESPVSVHLRLLWRACTVLHCAVVLTPEVVSRAGASAFAGAGAVAGACAGAGAGAGRRCAFCPSISSVLSFWLVFCVRTA